MPPNCVEEFSQLSTAIETQNPEFRLKENTFN